MSRLIEQIKPAVAANDRRNGEGPDLLYAYGPIARRLLLEANERSTALGTLRVVSS